MNIQEIEEMCVIAIKNYLRERNSTDVDIRTKYSIAIKKMMENYNTMQGITGGISNISSMSQGGQSITLNTNNNNPLITDDIKALLPYPCIWVW